MKKVIILINFIVLIGCKKSSDGTVEVIPLAPTELKVTVASKDQVNLTWKDNSTNETGYKIERKTDNGVFAEIGSTSIDITSYSDKTVGLNTNYTYRVYSFNKVGKSVQYSNEASIKTQNIPTITTKKVINVEFNKPESGFEIHSDGGSPIIAKGIVWSTASNPTINLPTKTSQGIGNGWNRSFITGFALGTRYYVRAYATNSAGTAYGNEISFTTVNFPEISTSALIFTTSNEAKLGGNIISNNGSTITEKGVVWSTTSNPIISLNTKTIDGKNNGSFQSFINGLKPNTKYYIRAYASNVVGTAYGNEISFTTAAQLPDGQVYGSNGKIWMDRNLGGSRVAISTEDYYSSGYLYQWGRGSDGHQYIESKTTNIQSNKDNPGHGLFIIGTNSISINWRNPKNDNLWQGVNGVNNPCPSGFRLPTMTEFRDEIESWKGSYYENGFKSPLKLPAIIRRLSTGEVISNQSGGYWTSTVDGGSAVVFIFGYGSFLSYPTGNGFCVRCIKN